MKRPESALPHEPLWYKDAIIYELHVKCFYDSNNDGIGDFQGLIEKLDYLQDLGVNCLWLLPFYPSPLRDDGYDISDYQDVHPSYGTLRDFKQLIREAHRRSIRIITELVINHTSDQHPWFQAARKAPAGSAKRDYYVWSDNDQKYKDARIIFKDTEKSNWTWDPVAGAYYWHRFFSHQPDLNFDNPHVRGAVMRVMRFWLDIGVDGMRLDAVPYLVEREGTLCENLPDTHAILKAMRKEMDAHYQDRIFLAEANQWPSDVRPYFGEGDECHMAFHFPLMPRIFMALRQEDRHPITDILRQTPDIPENCQWAIFLRNHDELTLEMVTDQERDYMYTQYATDPLMRLNLGIRRRLAPLVANSRRRLELLFSLLFSFPGTPVIYYGDEIGMGDNYYLGDRNGVRTPMQWSNDRNGGFSRAPFAQLYAPPLMDSIYSYQSTNVEAQLRDPSSFLNWMKRMIAVSKHFKTFGRGKLEFLNPANRKVLAYVRRYKEETFLAVANLSRFVQPAELNLSEFEGRMPVEMLGSVEFPKIGQLPYFLTLGPHSFYWFQLQRVAAPVSVAESKTAPAPQKVQEQGVAVDGAPFEKPTRSELEKHVLPVFLARQRWYGRKSEAIRSTKFIDWGRIAADDNARYAVLVEVESADGRVQTYNVPLELAWGEPAQQVQASQANAVVTAVHGSKGDGVLFDAIFDDAFVERWLEIIAKSQDISCQNGTLHGIRLSTFDEVRGPAEEALAVKRLSAEQSNTSVGFGRRMILKFYRKLDEGPNPDFEVSRYLTEQAHFDRVPRVAGGLEYRAKGKPPITLAMLQEWIENQGDGWSYTLDEIGRYFDRAAGHLASVQTVGSASAAPVTETPNAPLAHEWLGSYLYSAAALGKRTAELHRALAQAGPESPDFTPEPLTPAWLRQYAESVERSAGKILKDLEKKIGGLPAVIQPGVQKVLERRAALVAPRPTPLTQEVPKGLIRVHGDYHLGQVLWANNDFVILDFEGEPARSLRDRRARQSPLKDVAGMLRSFHYAAYAGLFKAAADRPSDFEKMEPAARLWVDWAASHFLKAYRETIDGVGCVPQNPAEFQALLNLFLLEKALYEVVYELDHRPNWLGIPLEGVLSLLQEPSAAEKAL